MNSADLALWATVLAGACAIAVFAWKTISAFIKSIRKLNHMVDDWIGEPAHGGQEARQSIPERLADVEFRTVQLVENGGSSMKDKVNKLTGDVASILQRMEAGESLAERVAALERDRNRRWNR